MYRHRAANFNRFDDFIKGLDTNSTDFLNFSEVDPDWIVDQNYFSIMEKSIANNVSINSAYLLPRYPGTGKRIEMILRCLINKPLLRQLDIRSTFCKDTIRTIVEILKSGSPLTSLRIHCNDFINLGNDFINLDDVAQAVISHSTLRVLYVRNANIKIDTLLRENNVLQHLSIYYSNICCFDVELIARALTDNSSLECLTLDHANIDNEGLCKIIASLKNSTIRSLSMLGNDTNNEVCPQLETLLEDNYTILHIDFGFSSRAIYQIFDRNNNIFKDARFKKVKHVPIGPHLE